MKLYHQKEIKKCFQLPYFLLPSTHGIKNNHESPKSSALGNAGRPSICFLSSQWLRPPVSRPPLIRARWSSGPCPCQRSLGNSTCTPIICSVALPLSPVQGRSAPAVREGPCSQPAPEHFGTASKTEEITDSLFLFPGRHGHGQTSSLESG